MKQVLSLRGKLRDSRGMSLLFVAILLAVFILSAALAVDIGYTAVVRNELQNVADAAALAGSRQLGSVYEGMSTAAQQGYVCDPATISTPVLDVASQNLAAKQSVSVRTADIVIGTWDPQTKVLTPTLNQPDAVRVTARRDNLANGPVSLFFARVIGMNTIAVSATATAALTGSTAIGPGELLPVGISKEWFDATPQFCGQPIKFNPSNAAEGCAGWNTYTRHPANDSYLRNTILGGWLNGTFTPPAAEVGVGFEFIGGNLSNNTFAAFNNLFNYMKTRDSDGDPNTWSAYVVVYSNGGCGNPNQNIPIVGFAAAKITSVIGAPAKTINAQVLCELVEPGRGGGGYYGVKGAIPGLVQ